jgi:hypothetical protein
VSRPGVRSCAVLAGALALAAAAVQPAGAARGSACASGKQVKTPSYVFALSIGPVETMYTRAEARAQHPKSGEVVLAGQTVTGMAEMTMSSSGQRHLAVHICTSRGATVRGVHPVITISDPVAKTMNMAVPVATMQGVGAGPSDIHYGNNVTLTAGHRVLVTVTLRGERAVFHAMVPRSSA